MKLHYYPETDSLYIELSSKPSADSQEVAQGVVLVFDNEHLLVGIDIDKASKLANLSNFEIQGLSMSKLSITE